MAKYHFCPIPVICLADNGGPAVGTEVADMNAIVAVDENWAIGKDGDQLVYIPEDLRRFRDLTMGHAVVLGRRTLATFPGGRPLEGRRNLVLSRDPEFAPEGAEVFRSLDALLRAAPEDAFVVGGASVYEALLGYCGTVYATRICGYFPADSWFPDLDAMDGWYVAEEGPELERDGLRFRYVVYKRRRNSWRRMMLPIV